MSPFNRALIFHRNYSQPVCHSCTVFEILERCNPWPHVANRHISGRYRQRLSQLLLLWRHWRHAQRYGRTKVFLTDTLPRLIYRDSELLVESRESFLADVCLAAPLRVAPSEYHHDVWHQKTRVSGVTTVARTLFAWYVKPFWSNSDLWRTRRQGI